MFDFINTRIKRWNRYTQTVNELNALSNRDLADLGIARGDIQRIAKEAMRG